MLPLRQVLTVSFSQLFTLTAILLLFSFSNEALAAKCPLQAYPKQGYITGKVERVVDGDTLKLRWKNKTFSVRYLGIDTPETHYQQSSQGYWGEEAHRRMARMLPPGTEVRIELDTEVCDYYGRMLGHVWKGNINVNRWILEEGLAVNYCIYPSTLHCEEYGETVDRMVDEGVGIWGDKNFVIPYEWRRQVSGRPFSKYIGNIYSKRVYEPGDYESVDIGSRIFFFTRSDVEEPYYFDEY